MNTNTRTTEIAYILDRSGSMSDVTEAAIAGFNQFLRDQQSAAGIARLTLVLFDDEYHVPIGNFPVSECVELDTTTYVPRGSTALLDAIGKTIKDVHKRHKALPKAERPDKVIFAIFTDGCENASRQFTFQDISDLIKKRREKNGWEFLFLGANQDAIATAAQMNIHAADAATATYSAKGVYSSAGAFSRKVNALRSDPGGAIHEDSAKAMSEILQEEEDRNDD